MRRLDEILKGIGASALPSTDTDISSGAEPAPTGRGAEEGVCPLCRGAGFVRKDVALDHPDFGRAFPCRCVLEERQDQRLARLQRYSNLGPLTRLTFANLMTSGRSTDPRNQERFAKAVATAQEFAQEPGGWLVLCGPSGCGKTHLAAAIANESIQRGLAAFFVVVPDLLDHLRAAYGPGSEISYDELFEQVRNAPLVILDDLGAQSATPWAQEKLFQLLSHRYNHRLPTVFTTSMPLEEMDERLRTRLGDASVSRVFLLEEGGGGRTGALGGLGLSIIREMTFESFLHSGPALQKQLADIFRSQEESDVWGERLQTLVQQALRSLRIAYMTARGYAENPEGWLVLLGETGCGKTHLAAAVGHYLEARDTVVHFCVVPDLLDDLRLASREDARGGHFDEVLEAIRTAPVLILDDLGVHSATPWAQEKLFQILNYRYNAKLPTVITVG
ncbi:MAG: ATP-binding protein, partial [Chloroflexota bacterium]|nr:ATP-binding protein [Chloroflexota bacterium]